MLKIRTSNEEFYRCFARDVADMAALRLPIRGTDHMVFVPAAAPSKDASPGLTAMVIATAMGSKSTRRAPRLDTRTSGGGIPATPSCTRTAPW